jgi:hypothetical protein
MRASGLPIWVCGFNLRVLSSAADLDRGQEMSSGVNVKDLEGRKDSDGEGGTLTPRDFFWDSVALFVISAIVGLTVLDVITEFVRGSNVECYLPEGIGEVSQEYINTFCSGNLPFTQYFLVYMIITGALIAIPHYLWLNHYRGNFEFFFSPSLPFPITCG